MREATAVAHPNIALIKYWGKRDPALNLPAVPSLSLGLGPWRTTTTVRWGASADLVRVGDAPASAGFAARALRFLDAVVPGRPPVEVDTRNDFPTAAGLASSASGFAALALAASTAADLRLEPRRLSVLARLGSGSAARSIPGGWAVWHRGERADGLDSFAEALAAPDWWDVAMVVAVVDAGPKPVGSTEGMLRSASTSATWSAWLARADHHLAEARGALLDRDLERLGTAMEASTFEMHATTLTASPPLVYWQAGTVAAIHRVLALRAGGVGAWLTIDAGPQVKVLCSSADAPRVAAELAPIVPRVEVLRPAGPARIAP